MTPNPVNRTKRGISRRAFLGSAAATCALTLSPHLLKAASTEPATGAGLDFPLIDFHSHLDNSTIDKVVELSKERGIKLGIVEHAGTKENQYPVVLSNDDELKRYLAMLEGKPVYKGIQAEWVDWMGCFSRETLAKLDYVLTDAMTYPGKDGQRTKLWLPGFPIEDKQAFMDHFVDWHVQIITKEPIDLLANVSWLPQPLAPDYDLYWTVERIKKVVDAAVEYRVALEISSSFRMPKMSFLKIAKAAGVKFTLGSNGRYPNMAKLDYSIEIAKQLGLKGSDMFTPASDGQKAVQRRKYAAKASKE